MNKYSVGIKLGAAFGILVSLLIGVGWLGLSRIGRTNADLYQLSRSAAKVELAQSAEYYANLNIRLAMQVLLLGKKKDIDEFASRRAENRNRTAEIMKALEPKIDSEKEKELLSSIESTRSPARVSVIHVVDLLNQGKQEEARHYMVSVSLPLLDNYQKAWDAFVQFQKDQMERLQNQSEARYLQTRQIAGPLMLLAIVLAMVIAGYATHRIIHDNNLQEESKAEIFKLNEQLESKVAKRTEDLALAIQKLQSEIVVRRKKEEDLQRSEMELATAQRIAHLGSFQQDFTNLDGFENNPLHWSDEVFRIFGYEPGQIEVTRANFMKAVHPDDREKVYRTTREAIQRKQSYDHEYRIILPNGAERTVHGQLHFVRDPKNGELIRMVGTVQDITERKKAEERFYKAFNVNPEPMTIATASEGRFVDVNESFLRVTGYCREEVIGRTSLELEFWARPEDRNRFTEILQKHGSVRDLEIIFRTKSGKLRTGLDSADVIELSGVKCIIAIFKDVTEKKSLEKQLRQSQKMEAIGQFSGGIAHDFNNLLGVIIGYSEVLEVGLGQGSELRKNAEEITKAGQRAASLTRQILAFSRQQMLEQKVLNLNTVVTETEKMLRRMIGANIELSTALDAELGQIKADQGQMEQVILNLAGNARDAMPDGGKLIIATENKTLDQEYALDHPPTVPGNYIMLTVTDTGIGMDAKTQAHIFEPFFTTKAVGKGTGLGLATVYGVVKQSGGYIWVSSEIGQGSTFTIFLPRVDEAVQWNRQSDLANGSVRGSETILLVEDEESLRALTRTVLEQSGYTVLEADCGSRAIEISRQYQGHIHLLLTDMVMPAMNGRAVAKKLMPIHPEMRVIYMSGYAGYNPGGATSSEAIFLCKPFTRDALVRKVHEVLNLQKESATL